MSLAQEIREAVAAAQAASKPAADDPYKRVLQEVAEGLTGPGVEARLDEKPSGRWTLVLAPAYQPGRGASMLDVRIGAQEATVYLDPPRVAHSPKELASILKQFVTMPPFLESLEEIARLSEQPVEGFLRIRPGTVSREDVMLEIPPETQKTIAGHRDAEVEIRARVASFRGAGTFQPEAGYVVLESAGFSIRLARAEQAGGDITLQGRVERTGA
jgi:hypothetical protein